MKKVTSFRLDPSLKEYTLSFGADYGFESVGALVNGILYYVKTHENPANCNIAAFLEDALRGDTAAYTARERNIKTISDCSDRMQLFFSYMDDSWGDQMLENFLKWGIKRYLKRRSWLEDVRSEFFHQYDIPLYYWEIQEYIRLWYERAENTGHLREINRSLILGHHLTEQTYLDTTPADTVDEHGEVK